MRVLPLFVLSLFAATAFAQVEDCPPRYSYCGYSGPAQWPNIPIKDKVNECGGTKQSPIDLPASGPTRGDKIELNYKAGDATVVNSGHDIRVIPKGDAGGITIEGTYYPLVNFHFHTPSEHHIRGVEERAEIHLVHQIGDDYAVIGVRLKAGLPYGALVPVFANLPVRACAKVDARIEFDKLLPDGLGSYYNYVGSLTTPPCSERVIWYVLEVTRTIPVPDLTKLTALGPNARLPQKNPQPLEVKYVRPSSK